MERWKPSNTVGGNVNWYNCYGKQYRGSLKNRHVTQQPDYGYLAFKEKQKFEKIYAPPSHVVSSIIYNNQDVVTA